MEELNYLTIMWTPKYSYNRYKSRSMKIHPKAYPWTKHSPGVLQGPALGEHPLHPLSFSKDLRMSSFRSQLLGATGKVKPLTGSGEIWPCTSGCWVILKTTIWMFHSVDVNILYRTGGKLATKETVNPRQLCPQPGYHCTAQKPPIFYDTVYLFSFS